jgi:hypothetical protein
MTMSRSAISNVSEQSRPTKKAEKPADDAEVEEADDDTGAAESDD